MTIWVEHEPTSKTLFVRLDRSKVFSHGLPSLSHMMTQIHVWHCTADIDAYQPARIRSAERRRRRIRKLAANRRVESRAEVEVRTAQHLPERRWHGRAEGISGEQRGYHPIVFREGTLRNGTCFTMYRICMGGCGRAGL